MSERKTREIASLQCDKCLRGGLYMNSEFCERCYRELHGMAPSYRKLSEGLVTDIVERIFAEQGYRILINMKIPGLNIYPDILVRVCGVTIIVEIDEHQHKRQVETDKERTRKLRDVFNPLVLIRINPDAYRGRVPMIHTKKQLQHTVMKKTCIYNSGEIESRKQLIENMIISIVIQIQSDFLVGFPKPSPFQEFRMFYDFDSVSG